MINKYDWTDYTDMSEVVEVVRKETAKEILDYFDRYAGTGKYLIGNMIRMQRKKIWNLCRRMNTFGRVMFHPIFI